MKYLLIFEIVLTIAMLAFPPVAAFPGVVPVWFAILVLLYFFR